MRVDFTRALEAILAEDAKSLLVSGDLGYNAFEAIQARFGRRFLNAGVAEQNMIGVAAGMALSGFRPWVYSIAPFATYRCFEQIRNDVCLHRLPVRIVGNGGGYTYGIMGSTHHALEDLGALKTLPNMNLFFPVANDQVERATRLASRLSGPSYLRLGISGFATAADPLWENPVTLTRQYAEGAAVTVIGVGHATQVALAALKKQALSGAAVFGVARYPFDPAADEALFESARRTGKVIVLDEHYAAGSIGESFRLALPPEVAVFELMAAKYSPEQRYGSPAFHLKQCGLTPDDLAARVAALAGGRRLQLVA